MPIFYALFENHLTSDPDDYMARVASTSSTEMEQLVDDIIAGGSTVTRPDILAVLDAYHDVIARRLLEGQRVNTPVANFGVSIQGTFAGASDAYDPSRHVVDATVSPGAFLRNRVRERAQPAKQEARDASPNPSEYVDFGSESKNSVLTPGSPGQLTGHRLKFDADDAAQGVFFVSESDGAETRATLVMRNKPAELMFMAPDSLAAGDYTVDVRIVTTKDGAVQHGQLRHILTVP